MNRRAFLAALGLTPLLARAASAPAVFVVHPYDIPSRLYARFRPLTRYLGDVIGRPLRLRIAHSYDEQIETIATGRADYAYLGPTPYVRVLAACRTLVVDSEKRPRRGQFLPDLPPHSPAMGQKSGEKWTAAVDLQPTIPKSDRLLAQRPINDFPTKHEPCLSTASLAQRSLKCLKRPLHKKNHWNGVTCNACSRLISP